MVIPRNSHKSDVPMMLDGTRLDESERRLGLPVYAFGLDGLARMLSAS